jgi:hypothetical protein
MKTLSTYIFLIFALNSYSQSIVFERDTIQILQNADVGSIAYADIDLDGDNDLVISGTSPITTTIYKNDGSGNFTAITQAAMQNVYAGAAEFADIDNDGDMDLLITGNTSSTSATANLYLNDGSGNFSIMSGTPFEPSNSGDIDFGDIDGDNDLDLVMTGKDASGSVFTKLYVNNGSGLFSLLGGTPFIAVYMSSTEFLDIDNDNDLDLLICGANAADISTTNLYKNNGSGTFTPVVGTPFENAQFGDIAFGDTDNDGDQDIFIVGSNESNQDIANLYINNGSSFSLLANTPFPATSLHSASFADFNNDGKLDLLQLGNTSKGLIGHVYENQGNNIFILSDSTLSGSYNGSNIVADLNGDNKIDIVTTGTSFTLPVRAPKIYMNLSATLSRQEFSHEDLVLNIFPNPSNEFITIEKNSSAILDMEVYNLSGSLVFQDSFAEKSHQIRLQEAPGIYLMRLRIDNNIYMRKVTILK